MVHEFSILFRVQDFQQGRGRVTLVRHADLIHLIQHDDGVAHLFIF